MNYETFFRKQVDGLRREGNYRVFADLERQAGKFPRATHHRERGQVPVTVWCSNDYLGMGQHRRCWTRCTRRWTAAARAPAARATSPAPTTTTCCWSASWPICTGTEAALLFNSGYMSQLGGAGHARREDAGLRDPVRRAQPRLDDRGRAAQPRREAHLRAQRPGGPRAGAGRRSTRDAPKLVAFESVYSMDGDIAPIGEICDVADSARRDDLPRRGACGRHVRRARRRHQRARRRRRTG